MNDQYCTSVADYSVSQHTKQKAQQVCPCQALLWLTAAGSDFFLIVRAGVYGYFTQPTMECFMQLYLLDSVLSETVTCMLNVKLQFTKSCEKVAAFLVHFVYSTEHKYQTVC